MCVYVCVCVCVCVLTVLVRACFGNISVLCCSGNETRLGDCPHVGFGNVTDCKTKHFAGALCFDDNGESINTDFETNGCLWIMMVAIVVYSRQCQLTWKTVGL